MGGESLHAVELKGPCLPYSALCHPIEAPVAHWRLLLPDCLFRQQGKQANDDIGDKTNDKDDPTDSGL